MFLTFRLTFPFVFAMCVLAQAGAGIITGDLQVLVCAECELSMLAPDADADGDVVHNVRGGDGLAAVRPPSVNHLPASALNRHLAIRIRPDAAGWVGLLSDLAPPPPDLEVPLRPS